MSVYAWTVDRFERFAVLTHALVRLQAKSIAKQKENVKNIARVSSVSYANLPVNQGKQIW